MARHTLAGAHNRLRRGSSTTSDSTRYTIVVLYLWLIPLYTVHVICTTDELIAILLLSIYDVHSSLIVHATT